MRSHANACKRAIHILCVYIYIWILHVNLKEFVCVSAVNLQLSMGPSFNMLMMAGEEKMQPPCKEVARIHLILSS